MKSRRNKPSPLLNFSWAAKTEGERAMQAYAKAADRAAFQRMKSGINSAAENLKFRPQALDDLEADLEFALAAVKELIASEVADRNEMFDAGRK